MEDSFARILVRLRKERRLSQRAAAEALGVSQALLSHYENGIREPKLDFVCKVADFYECSTDFLLGRTAERGGETDLPKEGEDELAGRLADAAAALPAMMEYLLKDGSGKLAKTALDMLSLSLYRSFRVLWRGESAPGVFSADYNCAMALCDVMIKTHELEVARRLGRIKTPLPDTELLEAEFPELWGIISELLSNTDSDLTRRLEGREGR